MVVVDLNIKRFFGGEGAPPKKDEDAICSQDLPLLTH